MDRYIGRPRLSRTFDDLTVSTWPDWIFDLHRFLPSLSSLDMQLTNLIHQIKFFMLKNQVQPFKLVDDYRGFRKGYVTAER